MDNPDVRNIEKFLHRLQQIVERQDVASLLLTLKELIPDYNPGAELLRVALSNRPIHAIPVINQSAHGQTKTAISPEITPAAIVN